MFSITIIKGRLVDAPKLQKKTKDGKEIIWGSYRVAVNRDRKVEGQPDVDFYHCITFGKMAEYIAKRGQKGTMVLLSGRIQTDFYINKENVRIPTFRLIVDKQEICSGWKQNGEDLEREFSHVQDYPMFLDEDIDYEIPML